MARAPFRIVLDTNTLLRGMLGGTSAAARVLLAAEHRLVVPLLSKPVIDEYRAVLGDKKVIERFPEITPELCEVIVRRLRYIGDYMRVPRIEFEYRRDPRDQKFIELAIALKASHILSYDRDLLTLPFSRGDAGGRFRQRLAGTEILRAEDFFQESAASLETN